MSIENIKTVACLGTGTMGHGIAFLAAKAGYQVRLFGRTPQSIERGLTSIDRVIGFYTQNGLLTPQQGSELKGRITGVTSLEEAAQDADLVTESIAEVLEVKQKVFAEMESLCKPGIPLSSNTSSLSPSAIARALKHPENFLVIHFCTPPYLMPAVEVCPCAVTRKDFMQLGADWVESLGSQPVVLEREAPGFLINRIQSACVREALHIVQQGWATPEMIDRAIVYSLGWRYATTGPLESADMGGLDIFHNLINQIAPSLGRAMNAGPILKAKVKRGELGLKSGQGLYNWPPERILARRSAREQQLLEFMKNEEKNDD